MRDALYQLLLLLFVLIVVVVVVVGSIGTNKGPPSRWSLAVPLPSVNEQLVERSMVVRVRDRVGVVVRFVVRVRLSSIGNTPIKLRFFCRMRNQLTCSKLWKLWKIKVNRSRKREGGGNLK